MKQRLNRIINKIQIKQLNNKGSITVLVMVAMMFLSILGMTMVTMTALNIQMKAVNTSAQGNFYDADSVLDEIKAGLADISSEAAKEAYTKVLENYVTISQTATMQEAFDEYYIDILTRKLVAAPIIGDIPIDGSASYDYDASVLEGLLPVELQGRNILKYKAAEEQALTDDLLVCPYGERCLVLKGIEITQSKNSFSTVLSSDIRMEIPSLSVSKGGIYPEYTRYAILADDQVRVDGTQEILVNGNIYAGTVNRNNNEAGVTGNNPTAGLVVDGGKIEVIGDSLITRGDILISNGGNAALGVLSGLSCNVWAQNIKIEPNSTGATGSTLAISGKTYIEDDLEMNGNEGSVTLKGSYYGYHYKKDYSTGELPATDSKYSSAILINGRENTLNMAGLNDLVVAGRSFISRGSESFVDMAGNEVSNKDILMGESLAVKSNQMAYYVPKSFITMGNSGLGTAYTFENGDDFMFDVEGYEDYLEFEVAEYLDATHPLTRYYLQESGSNLYYCYLNFKDHDAAVEFQKLYYASKKNSVDGSAQSYLSENGITLNEGRQMLLLSGNVLYREDSATNKLDIKIGNSGESSSFFDSYGVNYGRTYKSKQLGLISNLAEGYVGGIRLSDTEKGRAAGGDLNEINSLFYRLVDVDKITDMGSADRIPDGTTKVEVITSPGGASLGTVWITNGNFTFDSGQALSYGSKGIIIATGNVTLHSNFEGMVLAGGDIILGTTGLQITANAQNVQDMFVADTGSVFVKYLKERPADGGAGAAGTVDYSSYITYENWKKNEG